MAKTPFIVGKEHVDPGGRYNGPPIDSGSDVELAPGLGEVSFDDLKVGGNLLAGKGTSIRCAGVMRVFGNLIAQDAVSARSVKASGTISTADLTVGNGGLESRGDIRSRNIISLGGIRSIGGSILAERSILSLKSFYGSGIAAAGFICAMEGSISAQEGEIMAPDGVSAGGDIVATMSITTEGSLKAGGLIKSHLGAVLAGEDIRGHPSVEAHGDLHAGKQISTPSGRAVSSHGSVVEHANGEARPTTAALREGLDRCRQFRNVTARAIALSPPGETEEDMLDPVAIATMTKAVPIGPVPDRRRRSGASDRRTDRVLLESMSKTEEIALVKRIALAAQRRGGRVFVVGGAVRDSLLGLQSKDIDIEMYGIEPDQVPSVVAEAGATSIHVGTPFPVWKSFAPDMDRGAAIDVALPRREKKVGDKHTDFSFTLDPHMSYADASSRRDFTINAIGVDPLTGEIVDPHGGRADLESRTLRHTSPHFAEDALRVLRGAQFCGRFGLAAAPETVALCRTLSPEHLPKERLMEEFSKLILKSTKPSAGLNFLRETGWVEHFPELNAMIGVPQSPLHHPEGDVWSHTLHCMDAYAEARTGDRQEDIIVGLGVLCHDMGKPSTTVIADGKISAFNHEREGVKPANSFLRRLTGESVILRGVLPLVAEHMEPKLLFANHKGGANTDRHVRRLTTKVRIDRLARVCEADSFGRPPRPRESPDSKWIISETVRLGYPIDGPPASPLSGRDLMAAGMSPGPIFGQMVALALEMHIEGKLQKLTKEKMISRVAGELRHQDARERKQSEMLTAVTVETLKQAMPPTPTPSQTP